MEQTFYTSRDENPMGTQGFEFLEFASANPETQIRQFEQFGFKETAKHPEKAIWLFEQGQIRFLLNAEPNTHAAEFVKQHGPGVSAMGFSIKDSQAALKHLHQLQHPQNTLQGASLPLPAIEGVGKSLIYLVDKAGRKDYEAFLQYQAQTPPKGHGLLQIDHVTHNLLRGNMNVLANFYEKLFNFREIRYFNITGKKTGLYSRAMTSPCGNIRIPLNESSDDKSQIEEFLHDFQGEGIQHIALSTDNIYQTVPNLAQSGIAFLDTPNTYFDMIQDRLPGNGENLEKLRQYKILIDGNAKEKRFLLQIFTHNMLGPVFFEIIQRKGDQGFGEGNFQALFEAIERDQMERGVI